jgi:D-arginine dehydrogenase
MIVTDVVIIGGGIGGASLGFRLGGRCDVVILEAEEQPGYHSTGRSAALYTATYGHPIIRGLTLASREFLVNPPGDFAETPLLYPRGALWIAREDQRARLEDYLADVVKFEPAVRACALDELFSLCPVLEPGYVAAAIIEPHASDIDVHALHRGYLRSFRRAGGRLVTGERVCRIQRVADGWEVKTATERYACRVVVNAAGAWADEVAMLGGATPVGLTPKRRTAITFDPPMQSHTWPCVLDLDEEFYFKPDAGRVLASPADETPVAPSDVQAEELEIAMTIDRIERATTLRIQRVTAKWAGLRTFAADKVPVVGMDPEAAGFFWLAGQGGYGIMTSPALGDLAAAIILGTTLPTNIAALGIEGDALSPARFPRSSHADGD